MTMNRTIGRAMTAQVVRVNEPTMKDLQRQLADAEETIKRLRAELEKYKGVDGSLLNKGYVRTSIGEYYNGRPVIALSDAPMVTGVNYWTAYRYLQSGDWQGVQLENGRLYIYQDQPLKRRTKTRR